MMTTMFDFKFLLSSGSVDRGSRIKQACGEQYIHTNVNTPHPTPIPTPKKRGLRAKQNAQTHAAPPDLQS